MSTILYTRTNYNNIMHLTAINCQLNKNFPVFFALQKVPKKQGTILTGESSQLSQVRFSNGEILFLFRQPVSFGRELEEKLLSDILLWFIDCTVEMCQSSFFRNEFGKFGKFA